MNNDRLYKLHTQIAAQGLDGIALLPGPNMYYISGISSHISERPIILFIPAAAEPAIIIPTLEAMKAHAVGIPAARIFDWNDQQGYSTAFQQAAAELQLETWTLGVEALYMRVLEYELLHKHAPALKTVHAETVMNALRTVKDSAEIAAMEKAVSAAESALNTLLPRIKIGLSEKQVATMLTQELLAAGGESIAFGPIVSGGPNSASPHAAPTDRPLQEGDLLVIDWGVYVDGYPSDITRTFAVGEVDAELRHIYKTVKQSNEQGKLAARPGATGQDVDRAARKVIDDAGYGEQFFHRTGHGLGLEVHEEPNMVEGNNEPLSPGNVFTIEPGIYLPGQGGVRIEDNVLVTPDGCRSLTTYPRELITVGVDK
jgi:Xaa-Pro dipeptidase